MASFPVLLRPPPGACVCLMALIACGCCRVENHGYQVLIYSSYARDFKAAEKDEISWVTQLTVDRIPSLEKMLER